MSAENRAQHQYNLAETNAGYSISANQLFDFISANHYKLTGGTMTAAEVGDILDSLLIDTLSGLSVPSVSLEKYRLIYRDYLQQYEDFLIAKFTDSTVFSKVTAFDSAEVLAFYHKNPQRFNIKEQVRVWHILISGYGLQVGPDSAAYKKFTQAELRDEARDKIYMVYDLLNYGEPFENVAPVMSQDVRTKQSGGLVGWTTKGVYLDPFDSVAFHLKVGEYSKPYLDKDGWHLVYIDGHLDAGPMPIDSPFVFEDVRQALLADKRTARSAQVMDSLRQGLKIVSNDAILDTNIYKVHDEAWCGVINGEDTVRAYVLKYYEEGFRQQYKVDNSTADMKRDMLKIVADRYLALQAMRHRGWDKDTAVVAFEKSLRYNKVKQIVLNRQYDFDWTPTEEAVKDYYDKHISEYVFEKPTTLQMITVADSAFAVFLHDQAVTGLDLPEIYNQFSAVNPGGMFQVSDVMKVGANDLPFEIWQASVIPPIGGVSSIVKSGGNYVFVKILDRKESQNLNLARGGIIIILQNEHKHQVYTEFKDDLYKQFGVRFPRKVGAISLQPYWIRNKKPS